MQRGEKQLTLYIPVASLQYKEKNMNATTLALPSWTTEVQRYGQKAIFYTPIIWGAFQKNIAPVIISSAKGLAAHWFESECYWRQRITNAVGIIHNPITASISATYAELTSVEAQATYRHIRHIIREMATDALVIGLCGVVAIASGIELAQKVYRQVKAACAWVDAKLNPVGPQPVILPTVNQCLEYIPENNINDVQDDIQSLLQNDVQYGQEFLAKLEQLDEVCQPNGVNGYVPVAGEFINPEPHDVHQEVHERLAAIHSVPLDTPVEDIASALYVPGAEGTPKRSRSRKPKQNEGEAEVKANEPKRRRVAAKK
jgi:hypothetical protein